MELKIGYPLLDTFPITFDFGEAPYWYTKVFGYPHNGLDFGCPEGTSVLATDEGEVIYTDDVPDSGGTGVIIKHSWGSSLYWHLSKIFAKSGQHVGRGAVIGLSGSTGFSTGPHLHFAIKVTNAPNEAMRGLADPKLYIENAGEIEVQAPDIPKTYTVQPGDTLWGIAEKFYKNGFLWDRIYKANRDQIVNPQIIQPLQVLTIP